MIDAHLFWFCRITIPMLFCSTQIGLFSDSSQEFFVSISYLKLRSCLGKVMFHESLSVWKPLQVFHSISFLKLEINLESRDLNFLNKYWYFLNKYFWISKTFAIMYLSFWFKAIISGLKNPALDHEKKEAKQRSMDAMAQYVNKRVGLPIERLRVCILCYL